ncbi:MAG: M20/M25/M40 family metallo-hydrolase, partial [Planctomycetota bacterium]|nr:M20/M25/M40 family metallo-hydrolase [Planctomycetota bacterium]
MQSLARLLLLPLLAAPAFAQSVTGLPEQDPVVDAIYAIPDEDMQVMAILDELSNGIGPRLTSSTNLTEACHWAVQRFEGYGLENVRMVEWGTYPVGFDRSYKRGRMVQPKKMELDFTTNAWTPGTAGAQRGRALVAPANDVELEAVRALLPGSWLLCASGGATPRYDSTDEFRDRLGRACDEAGIFGVIMPVRGQLVRTDGRVPTDMNSLPTRVFISLRRDQFAELQASANAGNAVELEFDINQSFVAGPIPLYNVIAEIPGTDKAEEMVIFGGHIDSWDGARGAQDNGTGTSTTLEAARILAATLREQGLKPRRTIRFMLWSGEEQGLLGSAAYVEQHPKELPYISAVIVHDGGTNACAGIEATPSMAPMFEEVFGPMIAHTADAEDEDLRFRIAPVAQLTYPIGSDHDSYIPYGVPGFFWQQFGRTSYGYIHHTQHDFYEEAAPDYQRYTARIVASTAWRLANAETMVPRDEMRKASPPRRRMGISLGDD